MNNPWSAIEKPHADLNVRLVDEHHPLRLYWGVDSRNRYLFAYDADVKALPQKRSLPNLAGIEVHVVHEGSRGKLLLVLQDNSNWELFLALCSDLIRATSPVKDESAASVILIRRLQRWQDLLRRNRPKILTPDEIKGLMGELLFLRDLLSTAFGPDAAVAAWKGPEGAPQDFSFNETAVEIKCQSGGSKPVVRISSADQLSPQLPIAYLVVYTLAAQTEDALDTRNLNSLVAAVRAELAAAADLTRERFEDLLYLTGYKPSEEYEDHRYSVVAIKCYRLTDAFPRILSSSLLPGVESVSYSIRLDAFATFQEEPDWWSSSHEH